MSSSQPVSVSEFVSKTQYFLTACQDEVSLNNVSLNIINGIINLLDVKTLGQIIPDRCVPNFRPWTAYRVVYRNSYMQKLRFPGVPSSPPEAEFMNVQFHRGFWA
jgi:hypothetical protein